MTNKRDSPFSALERLRDQLPAGPSSAPRTERIVSDIGQTKRGPARAVVRLERKNRSGKEVTVIEKLGLSEGELERWCRELKQALGCGGSVENDAIVLQGDLRSRLPTVLTTRGVERVTVG
jgi:translation initiation factor 1